MTILSLLALASSVASAATGIYLLRKTRRQATLLNAFRRRGLRWTQREGLARLDQASAPEQIPTILVKSRHVQLEYPFGTSKTVDSFAHVEGSSATLDTGLRLRFEQATSVYAVPETETLTAESFLAEHPSDAATVGIRAMADGCLVWQGIPLPSTARVYITTRAILSDRPVLVAGRVNRDDGTLCVSAILQLATGEQPSREFSPALSTVARRLGWFLVASAGVLLFVACCPWCFT